MVSITCVSLMGSDAAHLSLCLCSICRFSLGYSCSVCIFYLDCLGFNVEFWEFFILEISYWMCDLQIFSSSLYLSFYPLSRVICRSKDFDFCGVGDGT
jgi:hypothetical protein